MNFRKVYLIFLIIVFILFALVQINDPDPVLWILIYLIPAFLVYKKLSNSDDNFYYLVIGFIFLLWAINIFPPEWEGVMLDVRGMKTLNIELGRESLGLGICTFAFWSVYIFDKIKK